MAKKITKKDKEDKTDKTDNIDNDNLGANDGDIENITEEPVQTKSKQDKNLSKDISLTDLPGVGPAAAEKLMENGFLTVMSIAVASPITIAAATGIGEKSCRKIISTAREAFDMGYETAREVLDKRKDMIKLKLNCEGFDEMLDGGFETGAITQLYAGFGGSKSNVCHLLSVTTIKEYPESYVVYVDTEKSFRAERIKQLCKGQGVDAEHVLKHILVANAYNSDHQELMVEKVEDLINNEGKDIKLMVIDSIIAHYRSEFVGRSTLSERQSKLTRHLNTLSRLSNVYNMAILVTNQVMSDPAQFFGDPTKAVGGNALMHFSHFIVYLRKGAKGSRVAKLVNAPNLPDGECNFVITDGGFESL